MKSLIAGVLAQKAAEANTPFYLVKIGTNGYTDCDITLVYDGTTYYPYALYIGDIVQSIDDIASQATISLGNVDLALSVSYFNGALKNEDVTIYEVYLDTDFSIIGVETLLIGRIEGQELDEQVLTLTVTSPRFTSNSTSPKRKLVSQCGWIFKDTECAYVGAEEYCDKSYDRCTVLTNTDNYGGFRHIPAIGTKMTWGTVDIEVQ